MIPRAGIQADESTGANCVTAGQSGVLRFRNTTADNPFTGRIIVWVRPEPCHHGVGRNQIPHAEMAGEPFRSGNGFRRSGIIYCFGVDQDGQIALAFRLVVSLTHAHRYRGVRSIGYPYLVVLGPARAIFFLRIPRPATIRRRGTRQKNEARLRETLSLNRLAGRRIENTIDATVRNPTR